MRTNMIRAVRVAAFALVVGLSSALTLSAQEGIVGDWSGVINSPQQGDIEMIVHVTAAEDGTLSATLDVPSQGGFGVPLEDVSFADGVFSYGLSAVAGSYEGTMSEDGETITGTWSQGGMSIELNMTRAEGD